MKALLSFLVPIAAQRPSIFAKQQAEAVGGFRPEAATNETFLDLTAAR